MTIWRPKLEVLLWKVSNKIASNWLEISARFSQNPEHRFQNFYFFNFDSRFEMLNEIKLRPSMENCIINIYGGGYLRHQWHASKGRCHWSHPGFDPQLGRKKYCLLVWFWIFLYSVPPTNEPQQRRLLFKSINRNNYNWLLLKNWAFSGLFFLYFRLFNTVDSTYKFCRWLDSNRGPLVSEATALPTAPQPLPNYNWLLGCRILKTY